MDTKALARSKRAHSQHNSKKFHPNPKSKPQSTATPAAAEANAKKKDSSGKQAAEKPRKPQLPSNWDRYEDEFDSSSEAVPNQGTSKDRDKDNDVVLPKSKGADFSYLISEAQSQLQSQTSDSVARFASFDDVLPDFNQGISSMLSVRGNGMLSWIGNDNFIVDDSSTISNEAFLSLDLHALATELEKLDVSRRLFIEADILPPQLDLDGSKETIKPESGQAENHGSAVAEQHSEENSDEEKRVRQNRKIMTYTATSSYSSLQDQGKEAMPSTATRSGSSVQSSWEETSLTDPVKNDSIQMERSILEEVDSVARFHVNDVEDSKTVKTSEFEALAAEAELDMLLNSFGEIKLPESSGMSQKLANSSPYARWDVTNALAEGTSSKQPSGNSSISSRSVLRDVDIADTIDDLLRETSNVKIQDNAVPSLKVVPPYVPTSSSTPTAVLDDFDSWLDTI